ncbi:SIMPL domain-containing protein [Escherichia fergusonii]|uniref:SIMPL domain-containing protein n=1 Tax=Escherichia fergusonii TaxID=564 RepID=UPI00209B0560|nr:SIMPL domain-containing protein [Escherichia fergusonii]MCO7966414.1 SIMPL domain-containing protein [Escherichia fergusonii]HCO7159804.1 SIMPL domain-containing protein [Escherichia fergusonii]
MSKVPPLLAAIILGAGITVCGYFVGDGIQHLKPNNRYVNVRGLSEKEVQADTAELTVSITRNANVTEELFPKLDAVQNQIIATFKSLGIKDDEIQPGQWTTKRTDRYYLQDDPNLPRLNVYGSVTVKTHNVVAVEKAVAKINELQTTTNGAITDTSLFYSFNGISALRAEMIAAATKDARNAALQFAADSGSQVGSIRDASQGVFQILASGSDNDDPASVKKTVRVVTTVTYELKD